MIDFNQIHYWTKTTDPPPLNETIGEYQTNEQIQGPTLYSYIYLGSKTNSNQKKVLKFIKCKRDSIYKIENEIETMSLVNHPNILKMEDYFLFNEYVCIVTPFIPLKSLHSFIVNKYSCGIPEKMASKIMYQLLSAVDYLHKINIWHRDIKPDNVLVVDSNEKNPKVVLADFGFARRFESGDLGNEFMGTPEFSAPEIFKMNRYTNKVDIWALGVSLFVMLTAKYPTCAFSNDQKKCRYLIERGLLNFQLLVDMEISPPAIDLVKKMCELSPKLRITAEVALKHPWIVDNMDKDVVESDNFVNSKN